MLPQPESKSKFDPVKMIGQVFTYAKHLRLMILMGALGISVGVTYYLFSIPLYSATSLVSVQSFGAPLTNREVPETYESTTFNRAFLGRFRSQRVQLEAAKRLGIIGETGTFEDLVRVVPTVYVIPIDPRHVEMKVMAYEPEIVRNFTEAMVEAFQDLQQQGWEEYRNEALERYAVQIADLEQRIEESIESMTEVERNQNLTEVTMEQQSLMEIPKKLIQTKERLARMDGVRGILERLETENVLMQPGQSDQMGNTLAILSLLASFEQETVVKVGDIVSRTGPKDLVAAKTAPEVVVEPSSVEGLEPWRELEKQRRNLQAQIKESSKIYLPDHEIMVRLNRELEEANRGLLTELDTLREKFDLEYVRLQEELKLLEGRLPEYYAATEKMGKTAFEYSSIAEMQSMWDRARERMSEKLATVNFAEDFDWVQIRYKGHISLRDEIPVSPSKSKLAILSLMVALAGALGVPTMLNLFDTSATTVQQLEEYTGLKGIGIVPLTSKEFLEEVHRSPAQGALVPNFLLEAFRIIRSNICLNPNHRHRSQVVIVTSSRPQEGKTTQAANLAWSFYSMGERTLLIDCDLRRGRVHALLGMENSPGMTRLLMGECTPDEAIVNVGLKGFDAIPRGPVIAGTTEILCQAPFERLIELFRKHYDRIVIDSPPVLGLSESSSLQRVVDGTVLVVRAEKTSRKDVMDAIQLLKKSDAHFFGFVLNAVDLSKASNYYYYYYYSAPYYDQLGGDELEEEQEQATFVSQSRSNRGMTEPGGGRGAGELASSQSRSESTRRS